MDQQTDRQTDNKFMYTTFMLGSLRLTPNNSYTAMLFSDTILFLQSVLCKIILAYLSKHVANSYNASMRFVSDP